MTKNGFQGSCRQKIRVFDQFLQRLGRLQRYCTIFRLTSSIYIYIDRDRNHFVAE